MGMGYAACSTVSIKYEDLKELCPNEIKAIETHEKFIDWGDLALHIRYEDEVAEVLGTVVNNLIVAFKRITEMNGSSLILFLTYYNQEIGSRYDAVEHKDYCIFELYNVYELSPAAKRLKSKLKFNSYVEYC